MQSTNFAIIGMDTSENARIIKDRRYHTAGIGAVATETIPDGSSHLHLNCKDNVTLDRGLIDAVLQEVGDYQLI